MPVFVYCLHVCTLFIKTHYSAINLILKTSETRVCVCVCVCVCVPLFSSTVLTASMSRGLLASEYSTKTMSSFRDVFTTRRDCRHTRTHAHTHTHTRLVHQGAPRFWRSNTESSEIHFYWGDINTVWSQQSDCCSSHSEVRGQRSEVRGQSSEVRGQRSDSTGLIKTSQVFVTCWFINVTWTSRRILIDGFSC